MAKRKRLTPATLTQAGVLETKDMILESTPRAPIAQVAGDAAARAALDELADDMRAARSGGRLVQPLPLSQVRADHLIRDRIINDVEEMAVLKASLMARGQQTPIEVVELEEGYGLISGYRRLAALESLLDETGEARFGVIQALIKPIHTVSDSYVAMVEENEIRANLSFYERARLAAEAARIGIYPTPARAVSALFAHAPPAKRSKINSFLRVHEKLGGVLQFPAAIPEKLGLALSKALGAEEGFHARVKTALRRGTIDTASQERAVLERCVRPERAAKARAEREEVLPDVIVVRRAGQMTLSGAGVTQALMSDLVNWLSQR